jgi:7-cyano-7-deazaguanine synthase in queuosine biosynthesis
MNLKSKRDVIFSYRKETNFLKYKQFNLERDILGIAYTLFNAEKKIKEGQKVSKVSIYLSDETYERIDIPKLRDTLKELLLLILLEDIKLQITAIDDFEGRVKKDTPFPEKEAIILFSAGVDSYSGIKIAERHYKKLLGLFVAHNDQPRIINIVDQIRPSIKTEIRTLYAPGMGSLGYSQLRGFLYILAAGAYCNLCNSKNILVTECGPTMYQPLFSPYDSITYTTHPYVLKAAKEVLDILLPHEVNIIIPFEDLTKAEVISNSGIEDFSSTHSCISQRFGDHDGSCFGCVIKRLACLVADVKDVNYRHNIFDESRYYDNLINLLEFSYDLLNDFEGMPPFETEKIIEFNKKDLFQRYALDNLAGFMLGAKKKSRLFKRYITNVEELKTRISEVQANKRKPDFKKVVK